MKLQRLTRKPLRWGVLRAGAHVGVTHGLMASNSSGEAVYELPQNFLNKVRFNHLNMKKLFEVPYNFSLSLIPFYKKYSSCISYLFLPPYKDDSINTRTAIETRKKGRCYMPTTRAEYEKHIQKIREAGLHCVVLWQLPTEVITNKILDYYRGLGVSGFIIGNDQNAKIIKDFDSNLLVIASLVQRIHKGVTQRDFSNYDYVLLYYPFNRALDTLKQLSFMKEKIILMPNTLCHIACPSMHHWFPTKSNSFVKRRDCWLFSHKEDYIQNCGFISPEHLYLFDDYVAGYKLQGREYSTELVEYICQTYFERESPNELLHDLLGERMSTQLLDFMNGKELNEYYNVKTNDILAHI